MNEICEMQNNKKSIKANAVLNSIRTILNLVFPLITYPYISRTLAVEEIGKYNFSQSIITYFLLIAALGIDKYAVREGAKFRDDRKNISEFASKVFSLNIVSTIVSYFFLFLYLTFSNKAQSYISCILIFSLQIFFTTIGTEWLYSIFEEYRYITIRSISFKFISLILLFIFVREPGDYLKYAAITVFATMGSNILNFIHAKKLCDIKFTFKFDWKRMLTPILIIFASNVAISIYVSSDTTMLGYLKDDYTVGIYSISTRIYNIIKPVLAAALTVTIPRMALYAGKGMKEEYDKLMLKVSNTLFLITIPAMVGLIMLSQDVVLIIGGQKYLESSTSLRLLSLAIIFSIFSTLFNQCGLLPYHREKYSLLSSVISAVENICLNFILIPLIAEKGAALTTVLAELTMATMNYYNARDLVKKAFLNKITLKNILTIAAGTFAIILICHSADVYISNMIIKVIVSVVCSVIAYAAILLILKNPIAKLLMNGVLARIKH